MVTAFLKFRQGAIIGSGGVSLAVAPGQPVIIENTDNTGVESWTIEVLCTPANSLSPVFPGSPVIIADGTSSTPYAILVPDASNVYGCWRIRLTVIGEGSSDVDIRNIAVATQSGYIIPSVQILPSPLPHVGAGSKPDEHNFASQAFGWAGNLTSAKMINSSMLAADMLVHRNGVKPNTGEIRLSSGSSVYAYDSAGLRNVRIFTTSNDVLNLGDASNLSTINLYSATSLQAYIGGSKNLDISAGIIDAQGGEIRTTGFISVGTNPAGSGALRLGNGLAINFRNGVDSSDIDGLTLNSSDELLLGSDTGPSKVVLSASYALELGVGGSLSLSVSSGLINIQSNELRTTGFLSLGTTPAASGLVRVPHGVAIITARNSNNTGQQPILGYGESITNRLDIGSPTLGGITYGVASERVHSFEVDGGPVLDVGLGYATWHNGVLSPTLGQYPTSTLPGQTLSIRAQSSSAALSNGGDLELRSGEGTLENGDILLYRGSDLSIQVSDGVIDAQDNEIKTSGPLNVGSISSASFLGDVSDSAVAPSFSWATRTNSGLFTSGEGAVNLSSRGLETVRFVNAASDTSRTMELGRGVTAASVGISLAPVRSGDGATYIYLNSASTWPDYSFSIYREVGANGGVSLVNRGTGLVSIKSFEEGSIELCTHNTSRWTIDGSSGHLTPSENSLYDVGSLVNLVRSVNTVSVFSNDAEIVSYASLGVNPAQTGLIRVPHNSSILAARNSTDTGNHTILTFGSGSADRLDIGSNQLPGITYSVGLGNTHGFLIDGDDKLTVGANIVALKVSSLQFGSGVTGVVLSQADSLLAPVAQTLTVKAQGSSGVGGVGGALDLRSGTGLSAPGNLTLRRGETVEVQLESGVVNCQGNEIRTSGIITADSGGMGFLNLGTVFIDGGLLRVPDDVVVISGKTPSDDDANLVTWGESPNQLEVGSSPHVLALKLSVAPAGAISMSFGGGAEYSFTSTSLNASNNTISTTSSISAGEYISVGEKPALDGSIRLSNDTSGVINFRGADDNFDVSGLYLDGGDTLILGDSVQVSGTRIQSQYKVVLRIGNYDIVSAYAYQEGNYLVDCGSSWIRTTGVLSLGTTPALSGQIRVPYNVTILTARDSVDVCDHPLLAYGDPGNRLVLGSEYVEGVDYVVKSPSAHVFKIGIDDALTIGETVSLQRSDLRWSSSVSSPALYQDTTTTEEVAESLEIRAQSTTAVDGVGGHLRLSSGVGPATNGSIIFQVGGNPVLALYHDGTVDAQSNNITTQGSVIAYGYIGAGGSPIASTGSVRLPSQGSIRFRNEGDIGDVNGLSIDSVDNLQLGDQTYTKDINYYATGNHNFHLGVTSPLRLRKDPNTSEVWVEVDSGASLRLPNIVGATTATVGNICSGVYTSWYARSAVYDRDVAVIRWGAWSDELWLGNGDTVANRLLVKSDGTFYLLFGDFGASKYEFSSVLFDAKDTEIRTTGFLSLGGSPATSGLVRVPSDSTIITARNSANSDNQPILTYGALEDRLDIGSLTLNGVELSSKAGSTFMFNIGGSPSFSIGNSILTHASNFEWVSTATSPTIYQGDSTGAAPGQTFTIKAQTSTAIGSTGGALDLRSGEGVTASGDVYIRRGSITELELSSGLIDAKSNEIRTTGFLSMGSNPATSGAIRLTNAEGINQRSSNGTTVAVVGVNASGYLGLGSSSTAIVGMNLAWGGAGTFSVAKTGTTQFSLTGTLANFYHNEIRAGTGRLSIGENPSTSGDIRLNSSGTIIFRNEANTANIIGVQLNGADILLFGGAAPPLHTRFNIQASGIHLFQVNSANQFQIGNQAINAFSSSITTTSYLAIGTTPATTGILRIPNGQIIRFRNAANSANINGLFVSTGDSLIVGDTNNAPRVVLSSSTDAVVQIGADFRFKVTSTFIDCYDSNVILRGYLEVGTTPAVSGVIRVPNNSSIIARNAANTADISIVGTDSSNNIVLGQDTGMAALQYKANTLHQFYANSIELASFSVGGSSSRVVSIGPSSVTQEVNVSLGPSRTGDGVSSISLHSCADWVATHSGKIIRYGGVNANFELVNRGTGSLRLNAFDAGSISFATTNTVRWYISSTGRFYPSVDNSIDIGHANYRVLNINLGTSATIGTNPATTGAIRLQNGSALYWRDSVNANNVVGLQFNSSDNLIVGADTLVNAVSIRGETEANIRVAGENKITVTSALVNMANCEIRTTGYLTVGVSPAGSGAIRLPNAGGGIKFRNFANSANLDGAFMSTNDELVLGQSSGVARVVSMAATSIDSKIAGTTELSITAGLVNAQDNEIRTTGFLTLGTTPATSGTIRIHNGGSLVFRNNEDSDNIIAVTKDAGDYVVLREGAISMGYFMNLGTGSPEHHVGFFNASPVSKPNVTGNRGTVPALANLLTALSNLGLISDNTTESAG